jgi:hypothetical protein
MSGATAQQPGPTLPVPVVARSPTLPRASVRLDADSTVGMNATDATGVDLAAGFGVGVTDDFELGAQLVPIDLSPEVTYTAPSLYAAYGAELSDSVQLIPMARIFLPLGPDVVPMLDASAKLALISQRDLRFTITPSANITFMDGQTEPAFAAPVALVLQPDRRFFVSLDSGVSTDPIDLRFLMPRPGDQDRTLFIPVGGSIGTTVGRPRDAVADISAGVYWPRMGEFSSQTAANTDDFTVLARVQTTIPTLPVGRRANTGTRPTRPR